MIFHGKKSTVLLIDIIASVCIHIHLFPISRNAICQAIKTNRGACAYRHRSSRTRQHSRHMVVSNLCLIVRNSGPELCGVQMIFLIWSKDSAAPVHRSCYSWHYTASHICFLHLRSSLQEKGRRCGDRVHHPGLEIGLSSICVVLQVQQQGLWGERLALAFYAG